MGQDKNFWQTWWFWVIIAISTVAIVFAIVFPIFWFNRDGESDLGTNINTTSNFEKDFVVSEDLPYIDNILMADEIFRASGDGHIKIGIFDENDNLIFDDFQNKLNENSKISVYFSFENLSFEYIRYDNLRNVSLEGDVSMDFYEYELVLTKSDSYFNTYGINYFEENNFMTIHDDEVRSSFWEYWEEEELEINSRYSIRNESADYIDESEIDYVDDSYYKENGVRISDEYIKFDYFKTFYMEN